MTDRAYNFYRAHRDAETVQDYEDSVRAIERQEDRLEDLADRERERILERRAFNFG